MPYKVKVTDDAERDIRQLPGHIRQRARRVINTLSSDPRLSGAKELRGHPGYYRIRLDRWRIIYHVYDKEQVILILRVRRKSGPETYGDLDNDIE